MSSSLPSLLQIAIDGPVGAGKSDVSARLAKDPELNLVFVNTGAMYRTLAYACEKEGVERKNEQGVLRVLGSHTIDLAPAKPGSPHPYTALLDGNDVTDYLFTPSVAQGASDVGTIPAVRSHMVTEQQKLAAGKRVVMEGRDIGLRVLPDAQLKIYLTASVEERSQRRKDQLHTKGIDKSLEVIISETKFRDEQDMNRTVDPLQILPDAWVLDTTGITQDEVIGKIKEELRKRKLL